MQVFDRDGNEIADFEISEKQQKLLELGEEIVVLFHTPQLFRGLLGERSGSFMLRKIGARIIAMDDGSVRKYADMLRAVKQARENA
jgi:hypothetical protein